MGLYPRNAANRIDTGGRCANRSAGACETPWAWSPPSSVSGSVAARPRIMSVKKIPIESTCAECWNVWFHPTAGASVGGREAVHHPRAVGRREHSHRDARQPEDEGELRVSEVSREEHQEPG